MSASTLVAHLSAGELGQRYRAARCPIERSHLHIIRLLSQGRGEREVALVTGYGRRWLGEIVRRYNAQGLDGLVDRRRKNAGAEALLGEEGEAELRAALTEAPADGGLWMERARGGGVDDGAARAHGQAAARAGGTTSRGWGTARKCRAHDTPRRRARRNRLSIEGARGAGERAP